MVERRRLQGKENIRAAVKKLLNKYKVGSYYRLDIRDDGFDFELDETTMDADASRLASGNSELANKRLQRWKRHVETIAKQVGPDSPTDAGGVSCMVKIKSVCG